jgi:hypothetical protein
MFSGCWYNPRGHSVDLWKAMTVSLLHVMAFKLKPWLSCGVNIIIQSSITFTYKRVLSSLSGLTMLTPGDVKHTPVVLQSSVGRRKGILLASNCTL